jgi:hypothetical protein
MQHFRLAGCRAGRREPEFTARDEGVAIGRAIRDLSGCARFSARTDPRGSVPLVI